MPETVFEYVKAHVDCGKLWWEYQVAGNATAGRQDYEGGIEVDWSDEEIRDLTGAMLGVPDEELPKIEIVTH